MNLIYKWIRPFITRGDVLSSESISDGTVMVQAIAREEEKHSRTLIMREFYKSLAELMDIAIKKKNIIEVMDVGCARGEHVSKLALERPELSFAGIDIMDYAIAVATERYKNIYNLAFYKKDFLHDETNKHADLILCLEALEHIEDNSLLKFTAKLFSSVNKAVIISVPREPLWCLANMIRFTYFSRFGNTPSHLQHWTKRTFKTFVTEHASNVWGENIEIFLRSPLNLWTIVLLVNNNKSKYK